MNDHPSGSTQITVLVMAPTLGDDLSYVKVDPSVTVVDGNSAFVSQQDADRDDDVRDDNDPEKGSTPEVTREERDRLLAAADVLVVGYPVPRTLAARAPQLQWVHHPQAGVSNLHRSDLWTSDITLTTGRGIVSVRGIAEYAIAATLFAARGLDEATRQKGDGRFSRAGYDMRTVAGSTIGIVGLGGIGREVGRIAQALGMRVLATRWSINTPERHVDGADLVVPADRLLDIAAESDVLVVCSQLTEQTRGLINRSVFDAMPAHAVLVNVARGEEVDEDALVDAINTGGIAGAVLDVYDGELDGRPPRPELLAHPNILLTPHLSGAGDRSNRDLGRQLVADNVRRFLAGEPLLNVVDRQRGY